jgi:hypothetical protein
MALVFALFIVGLGIALVGVLVQLCDGQPLQPTWKQVLIRRCEEQHAAIMRGDERLGTFGEYPPEDLS